MKRINLSVMFGLMCIITQAQSANGQWNWIDGDYQIPLRPNYRTKGVPDAISRPQGRYNTSSWTDTAGNFWLFGGKAYSNVNGGIISTFNDLWNTPLQPESGPGRQETVYPFCTMYMAPREFHLPRHIQAAGNQQRHGRTAWGISGFLIEKVTHQM